MGRPTTQRVQTPGAPTPDTAAQDDADTSVLEEGTAAAPGDSDDVAQLKAQLAAAQAENAGLKAAAEVSKLPQLVYEPETPHGKLARDASEFKHLTVAQLMAEIDAGNAREPMNSVLCADGYYCRRR